MSSNGASNRSPQRFISFSTLQYGDEKGPQCGVGYYTSERVEHAVGKDAVAVFYIFAYKADGGNVGGQRAGAHRREQAEQKGRDDRYLALLEQGLQEIHVLKPI